MLQARYLLPLMLLAGCRSPVLLTREVVRHDTTIVTRATGLDSQRVLRQRDTVHLTHERLSVRILRQHDTFRIQAACAPETLVVPRVREVIRVQAAPEQQQPFRWWLAGALLLALGWGLLRRLLF